MQNDIYWEVLGVTIGSFLALVFFITHMNNPMAMCEYMYFGSCAIYTFKNTNFTIMVFSGK